MRGNGGIRMKQKINQIANDKESRPLEMGESKDKKTLGMPVGVPDHPTRDYRKAVFACRDPCGEIHRCL
jgi:hypothetical protein